ncbi:MAG: glycosyltransferase [Candidatus Omnitrophota bacterium]
MKIFIVHASAGAGHKKAADAIKDAFDDSKDRQHEVRVIDCLDYTNSFFKRSYVWGYNFLVSDALFLWGIFFYVFDFRPFRIFVKAGRACLNFINGSRFYKFIIKENPDCVISTHFLSTEIIGNLKRLKLYKGKLITCVTDYGIHAFWISMDVDVYVVASEYSKRELARKGIAPEKIRVLGIPVQRKFTVRLDRNEVIEKLGLRKGLFNILLMGGGLGVGPIPELVEVISRAANPFQLLVVCGKNEDLSAEVKSLASGSKIAVKIYGFIENVNELMDACDVLISKPGGLSISEALVKGLPILSASYIPGHEAKNLKFLEKNNVGIKIKHPREALQKLQTLYSSPELLASMRERARQLGKPTAAGDIVLLTLEELGE